MAHSMETRRGGAGRGRGGRAGSNQSQSHEQDSAGEVSNPGPSYQTGSAAARIQTAGAPVSMKDSAYLLARSNYNTAKIAANNAIELVTEMATRMEERAQGNATASVLRQSARRLQGGMDKAEEEVDGQILLGTELVSLSSYLALLLADLDSVQAGQADQIQLSVGAEIKPLRKNLDKIYDEHATLFDMAGEQASSQGSSACSSRAVSLERKRNHFNEFVHLKPSHLSIDCTVEEYNKWETGMTEWMEHAFPNAQQSLV